ncbi:hypothetical protein BC941DRAFT_471146 [Chlamydoabsidia padenii]|nr:hypothetical protein BC941DRAFT_471146 [Chlamydoabsidia padenii]
MIHPLLSSGLYTLFGSTMVGDISTFSNPVIFEKSPPAKFNLYIILLCFLSFTQLNSGPASAAAMYWYYPTTIINLSCICGQLLLMANDDPLMINDNKPSVGWHHRMEKLTGGNHLLWNGKTDKAWTFDDGLLTKTTNLDKTTDLDKTTNMANFYDNYLGKTIKNINFDRTIQWCPINGKDTLLNNVTGNITNMPPVHISKYISPNHHDLVPDNEGCYLDVFGTTLCVDQDSLLNACELKDQMNTFLEALTFGNRSYTF